MSRSSTFIKNISSNLAGYLINVIVALLLSPFVVHSLGDNAYGIWTLIISFTGYYGLLDLGIRSGVGQYVTRYMALDDHEGVNRTLNTAFVLLTVLSILIVITTVILALLIPSFTNLEGQVDLTRTILLISGFSFALTFPLAVYSTVPYALERFDVQNILGITERIVAAGLTVAVLKFGWGLLGLAIVTNATQVSGWAIRVVVARFLYKKMVFKPKLFAWVSVREMASHGMAGFFINANERIIQYTDSLLIGIFMSTSAITYYAIAGNLIPYYALLISSITWAIAPYAIRMDAIGDSEKLKNLYIVGTRTIGSVSALIFGGILFLGKDFISLWMGEKYIRLEGFHSTALILSVLAGAALWRTILSPGRQILFGARRMKIQAVVASLESIANVALSLLLVKPYGLLGIALGTLISTFFFQGIILPLYLLRLLRVPFFDYLLLFTRAIAPTLSSMYVFHFYTNSIENNSWFYFLIKALILWFVGSASILVFTLTKEEQYKFLTKIKIHAMVRYK